MPNDSVSEDRTVPMDFIQQLHKNPVAYAEFGKLSSGEKLAFVRYVEEMSNTSARQQRITEIITQLVSATK